MFHRRIASARKVLKKSSELWKKLANVSRSTMSVGLSSQTSHWRSSVCSKALNQLTFQPGKCFDCQTSLSVVQSAASVPLRYAIFECCCWCLLST